MPKQQRYKDLLDDLCSDDCIPGHYCILKEFIMHSGASPRLLMQLKCVEKFKYERSQRANRELTWTESMQQWVDEGFANRFSSVYSDDARFTDLYKALTSQSPSQPDASPATEDVRDNASQR